jgi:uncharacterized protein
MMEVAEIRKAAGLTQRQLADLSGVAQSNIASYETGLRRPSAKMVARLAAAAKPRPSTALHAHRDEIVAIARRHKALEVKVFGSVARGDDRPGSDVDLLVTFAPDASLFDQIELEDDVREVLGVDVDVVSANGLRADHARIAAEARPL